MYPSTPIASHRTCQIYTNPKSDVHTPGSYTPAWTPRYPIDHNATADIIH